MRWKIYTSLLIFQAIAIPSTVFDDFPTLLTQGVLDPSVAICAQKCGLLSKILYNGHSSISVDRTQGRPHD